MWVSLLRDFISGQYTFQAIQKHKFHTTFSYGRSSLNVGDEIVDPASSLVIQYQQSMIFSRVGYDVMDIPESYGLRFDIMRHIHRFVSKQVSICT